MSVKENIKKISASIPPQVRLVAVSKTYPVEIIREAYDAGLRVFGENRVQELSAKYPLLPDDIQWHLIGHLQKNKVKYIVPFVSMIHAVDDIDLLKTIEKEASRVNRIIPCLIQIHIAREEAKYGFSYPEAKALFESGALDNLTHVKICGLMGMATFTQDQQQVRNEFRNLALFFGELKNGPMKNKSFFSELSMGMSGDYLLAISEGSTMVRIGSAIFGKRD